jgi:hypothetical protein
MYRSESFYDDVASRPEKHVHIILIATKPDIIKQVPLYKELMKRGHLVLLGHTGQHYDENLSGGMLKEFGVIPDFNLNVRGSMHEVVVINHGKSPNTSVNIGQSAYKQQWAAVKAARSMAREKPLSFVMASLYDQVRTYFQSQT